MNDTPLHEKVGTVTREEVDTIQKIYERKASLTELFPIVDPSNTALYEKIVADMVETKRLYQQWWNETSAKYQWKGYGDPKFEWSVDFDSGDVFLIEKQ